MGFLFPRHGSYRPEDTIDNDYNPPAYNPYDLTSGIDNLSALSLDHPPASGILGHGISWELGVIGQPRLGPNWHRGIGDFPRVGKSVYPVGILSGQGQHPKERQRSPTPPPKDRWAMAAPRAGSLRARFALPRASSPSPCPGKENTLKPGLVERRCFHPSHAPPHLETVFPGPQALPPNCRHHLARPGYPRGSSALLSPRSVPTSSGLCPCRERHWWWSTMTLLSCPWIGATSDFGDGEDLIRPFTDRTVFPVMYSVLLDGCVLTGSGVLHCDDLYPQQS